MLGRGVRVDLRQSGQERPVEVAAAEQRQHVVLVDRLALGVRQERGLVAGAGVQLDLAVAEAVVEVVQDDQPVVEALPADAPLVDERGARPSPRAPAVSLSGLTWV